MADFDSGDGAVRRLCSQLGLVWLTLLGFIVARAVLESGQADQLRSRLREGHKDCSIARYYSALGGFGIARRTEKPFGNETGAS